MKVRLALVLVCAIGATTSASQGRSVDIGKLTKGAHRIVVALVTDVQPRFDVNEYGDRLIVSRLAVNVDETLKGTAAPVADIDVEGGTIGDLTLEVSDTPKVRRGQRGVFFLEPASSGIHRPHGHGVGLMMLDQSDHVVGSGLSLAELRAAIRAALQ